MERKPLELCATCKAGLYVYNFDNRCCKARLTAIYPKEIRERKYKAVFEQFGKDAANALIEDVNEYRRLAASLKPQP